MKKKNLVLFLMFLSFNIFMNPLIIEKFYEMRIFKNNKTIKKSYKEYKEYQWDSEALVYGKIISDQYNLKKTNFLQSIKNKNEDYTLNWTFKSEEIDNSKISLENEKNWVIEDYYQQYGFQGKIFSFFYNKFDLKNPNIFYFFNILISSFIFIYMINWIIVEFGFVAGMFSFLSILASPYLVRIIRNLYWVSWTLYFPFAISIFNERNKKNYFVIFITSFLVIFLKCLNGYEFISTLLVSLEIVTCFYYFNGRYKAREFFKRSITIGIGGIVGFLGAIYLHVRNLVLNYGSLDIAIYKFLTPIKTRTNFGGSVADKISLGIQGEFEKSLDSSVLKLVSVYIYKKGVIFIFPIIVILLILFFIIKKDRLRNQNGALLKIIGISFLGTLSWIILAKGHAYHHKHIDYILWSIPFTILVFAYFGKVIEQNKVVKK